MLIQANKLYVVRWDEVPSSLENNLSKAVLVHYEQVTS